MNLQPIIDRIKAQCAGFKVVGGAADLDAALDAAPASPACYVVPLSERSAPGDGVSFVLQRVDVDFAVVFAVRNARSSQGGETLADMETLRASVRSAILNYKIADCAPIRFASGSLLDFQPGLMWWQDGYTTAHHIQSS